MRLAILFVLFSMFPPELRVNWAIARSRDAVKISVHGMDEVAQRCRKSGLQLRYRYELQYCKEARYWADSCSDTRVIVRSLQWDPISQTFRVTSEILGDEVAPATTMVNDEETALARISNIDEVRLTDMFPEESTDVARTREYLQVRLLTQCKGENSATVERLSYFLSLGMVRTNGFDSGWISFRLDEPFS